LSIPLKRATTQPVDYLEYAEICAVLDSVDRTTADGRRDYAILATMFNTGARVQEIIDLRVSDCQLIKPCQGVRPRHDVSSRSIL
jgi:integrase/recombinase XerD